MRTRRWRANLSSAVIASIVLCGSVHAEVQNFTNNQGPQWFDAVAQLGDYSVITFTDYPKNTFITTQYQSDFGVIFLDGNDRIDFSPAGYPSDSFGIDGNLTTTIAFDTPQNWFAVDHPGLLQIRLYQDDELFHTSPFSGVPIGFNGVISDLAFDKVQLFDPSDSNVNIDNMYFGAVPAPGAILIVTGFLALRQSGRRTECAS